MPQVKSTCVICEYSTKPHLAVWASFFAIFFLAVPPFSTIALGTDQRPHGRNLGMPIPVNYELPDSTKVRVVPANDQDSLPDSLARRSQAASDSFGLEHIATEGSTSIQEYHAGIDASDIKHKSSATDGNSTEGETKSPNDEKAAQGDSSKHNWEFTLALIATLIGVLASEFGGRNHLPAWLRLRQLALSTVFVFGLLQAFLCHGTTSTAILVVSIIAFFWSTGVIVRDYRHYRTRKSIDNAIRNLSFVVMLQKDDYNVLDFVTILFCCMALENNGWLAQDLDPRDKSKIRFHRGDSQLTLRLVSQRKLERNFRDALDYHDADHSRLEDQYGDLNADLVPRIEGEDLKNFISSVLKHELVNALCVMGHAETVWTTTLGSVYAHNNILHLSPYGTGDDLEDRIDGLQLDLWGDSNNVILRLPPQNDKQVECIASYIRSSSSPKVNKVLLLADSSNKPYSMCFVNNLKTKLGWNSPELNRENMPVWHGPNDEELTIIELDLPREYTSAFNHPNIDAILRPASESDVIILAGMYEFVLPILRRIDKEKALRADRSQVIIATDGVVNGDDAVFKKPPFMAVQDRGGWSNQVPKAVYVTFPSTCMSGNEPRIFGRTEVGPNSIEHVLDPSIEKYARLAGDCLGRRRTNAGIYRDISVQDWCEALGDPNFGMYVWAGAYFVGKVWENVLNYVEEHAQTPEDVIIMARSIMVRQRQHFKLDEPETAFGRILLPDERRGEQWTWHRSLRNSAAYHFLVLRQNDQGGMSWESNDTTGCPSPGLKPPVEGADQTPQTPQPGTDNPGDRSDIDSVDEAAGGGG